MHHTVLVAGAIIASASACRHLHLNSLLRIALGEKEGEE